MPVTLQASYGKCLTYSRATSTAVVNSFLSHALRIPAWNPRHAWPTQDLSLNKTQLPLDGPKGAEPVKLGTLIEER